MTAKAHRTGFYFLLASLYFAVVCAPYCGWSQIAAGSMDVHWNEGAVNCAASSQPPLQLHRYNDSTFVLREGLCITWEAPFMYLLIGSQKALLIDTGDVAANGTDAACDGAERTWSVGEPHSHHKGRHGREPTHGV